MEGLVKKKNKEEIYSRVVRAGKRTYFFDVKESRNTERFLTITESKRRFSNETGRFFFEKHKIFLYREDFEKFVNGLASVMEFVETGIAPPLRAGETENDEQLNDIIPDNFEAYEGNDEEKN